MVTKYDDNQKVEYFGMGLEGGTAMRNTAHALTVLKDAVDRCYDEDVLYSGETEAAVRHLQKGMTRKVLGDNLLTALRLPGSGERQRAAMAALASLTRNV